MSSFFLFLRKNRMVASCIIMEQVLILVHTYDVINLEVNPFARALDRGIKQECHI